MSNLSEFDGKGGRGRVGIERRVIIGYVGGITSDNCVVIR